MDTEPVPDYRNIDVSEPVEATDWLQCDVPLCSLRVHSQQLTCLSCHCPQVLLSMPNVQAVMESSCPKTHVYSYQTYMYDNNDQQQISTKSGLQTVLCHLGGVNEPCSSHSQHMPDADKCQALLVKQLQTAFLCYHGYIGRNTMVAMDTTDRMSQRLLAFSQQLSENILNEALQISSHQVESNVSLQEQHNPPQAPQIIVVNSSPTTETAPGSQDASCSTAGPDQFGQLNFVHIPVEIEFSEPETMSPTDLCYPDHGQAFMKIVLVEEEEEEELNDSGGRTFMPHSVQRECILEEAQKDLSSSDNSPGTPQECSAASVQSFAENFVRGVISNHKVTPESQESSTLYSGEDTCVLKIQKSNIQFGVTSGMGLAVDHMEMAGQCDHDDEHDPGETDVEDDRMLPGISVTHEGSGDGDITHGSVIGAHGTDGHVSDVPATREAIEGLVDRLLQLAFHSGFSEFEARSRTGTGAASVCAPANMTAITEYVDGMIDDTFDAAMYRIREYVTEISRNRHANIDCKITMYMTDKKLDQEWNAQLSAFVDDFVMNIMEEALFINKTQTSDFRMRSGSRTKKRKSSDYSMRTSTPTQVDTSSQTINNSASTSDPNTKFFEVEFNVDFHNSIENQRRGSNTSLNKHYLRAEHSSGSSRRGSYEEDSLRMGQRRSSAGFKDVMLSEFEDELIHSDISTPSLKMFDDETEQTIQRRASEPFGRTSNLVQAQNKDTKRAQSVDSGNSRRMILHWLDNQNSNTSTNHSTGYRKRTSYSHLDWFAQDLLVEAFNDAFVALFGRNYEGLQEFKWIESTIPELSSPTDSLVTFAESLTQKILQESLQEIATHSRSLLAPSLMDHLNGVEDYYSMSDSQDEYMDALDLPLDQLEQIAEEFSAKILEEALCIVQNDLAALEERNIVTVISKDPQFGVLLQWAAVSRAGVKSLVFNTKEQMSLEQLTAVVGCLRSHHYSVADLLHLVLAYIEDRADDDDQEPLFTYILERLHRT